MRNIREWRKALAKGLRRHWPDNAGLEAAQLCDVELGLTLLSQVAPHESGEALSAFLQGTDFGWSAQSAHQIAVARHLLIQFRSPQMWNRVLQKYADCPDHLRGFEADMAGVWQPKPVSIEPGRFALYAQTLTANVPHRERETSWAQAGAHRFALNGLQVSAEIPDSLCFAPPAPHPFEARATNAPFAVAMVDLLVTAQEMDVIEAANGVPIGESAGRWFVRLNRVQLLMRSADETFEPSEQLDINGFLHLAGMVSSGKSTLMEVLAVHAARQGRRVTLVLADVIDVLRRASLFERLGIRAAPILGASGRQGHLDRLHRFVAAQQPDAGIGARHEGFRWLSTACALDGLRVGGSGVIPLSARPCTKLMPADAPASGERACPIYARCDFHRAALDARHALIWLATPASLVCTRVSEQLSPNRVRWAEMIYRRSDLVIFDEADRVQMGLDAAFSPSEVLISRGDTAWMPKLQRRVSGKLNQNLGVLADAEVDGWCQSHGNLQNIAQRLYGRLQRQSDVRSWIARRNYFTDRLLFDQIALRCSGANAQGEDGDEAVYQALFADFDACMDDPLGSTHGLSELMTGVVLNVDFPVSRARDWLQSRLPENLQLSPADAHKWGQCLEAALLVTALQNQLAYVLKMWRSVEAPLELDDGGNLLFQNPPDDYKPVLPLPPMGRELAFQYLAPDENPNGAGDLRFFRCEAVGRALMLNFHKLWVAEGVAGPHTLLLSGTSWAGTSPSCHVQTPVGGILRAPAPEIAAIETSQFRFYPLRYPAEHEKANEPIRVSGTQGDARERALRAILHRLAVASGPEMASPLELQRDSLPQNRRRILLLTGSYAEAQLVYRWFTQMAPNSQKWKGAVRVLTRDNDEDAAFDEGSLPRGLVDQFGGGDAWILIAPLLAIERGHNIINPGGKAAIGAAYFLVRPHPRPDDIGYAIHSINRWALDDCNVHEHETIGETARDFRRRGRIRWNALIRHRLQWSALETDERAAVTWTQMVAIWQVIGRLVRGGERAEVFFCDAAFAPRSAIGESDDSTSSLLVMMRHVLRPYFADEHGTEAQLVRTLYGPLWSALQNMLGLAENNGETESEAHAEN